MENPRSKIVLLSPAKDLACGIAAVDHGADAVYIGGPGFGARANAANPVEDIEALAAYAHRYHARVYVTLNTILTDEELPRAVQLVHRLHEAGADALIIQDMGLLNAGLPPIALHASTQTDNRTVEKVRFLEDAGFSQVVLARELTVDEVRRIAEATTVRLEYFIHGALCVSYSGQCYLSHAMSGRSANRGECSQPCRHSYKLADTGGNELAAGHLLSLRDMNQTGNLERLIDAGVSNFKIEGRLKDICYVKNVTAWYRRRLDAVLEGRPGLVRGSTGRSVFFFEPDPEKSFNRSFTDYFAGGKQPGVASFDAPTYAGEYVGKVKRVSGNSVTVAAVKELHNGDGLSLFKPGGRLAGLRVNRVEGDRLHATQLPYELEPGVKLYRNHDHEFERALQGKSAQRVIGLTMEFGQSADAISLSLTDEDGVCAEVSIPQAMEPAKNVERAVSTLREQLAKLGNTPFVADSIVLPGAAPSFIPVSVINRLRRKGVEELEKNRLKMLKPLGRRTPAVPATPYPEGRLSYLGNVSNRAARQFYLEHGVEAVEDSFETGRSGRDDNKALMTTRYCLLNELGLCLKESQAGKGPELTLAAGATKLTLTFDCMRCEMKVSTAMAPKGSGKR